MKILIHGKPLFYGNGAQKDLNWFGKNYKQTRQSMDCMHIHEKKHKIFNITLGKFNHCWMHYRMGYCQYY